MPTVRKTLFLGIGGFGKATIIRLRRRLFERYGRFDLPFVRFVVLDTDSQPKDNMYQVREDRIDRAVALRRDIEIEVIRPTPRDIQQILSGNAIPNVLERFQWLDPNLKNLDIESIQEGAGGIRALGKLMGLRHHLDKNDSFPILEEAIRDLVGLTADGHRLPEPWQGFTVDSPEVDAHVFCSTAGGTGSGLFVDLGFYLWWLFDRGRIGQNARLGRRVLYLYLADILTDVTPGAGERGHIPQKKWALAGTFGALSELDYFMNLSGDTSEEFRFERGFAGTRRFKADWAPQHDFSHEIPYKIVFPIGRSSRNDKAPKLDVNEATSMVANYLHDFVLQCGATDGHVTMLTSVESNIQKHLLPGRYDLQGGGMSDPVCLKYAALGYSRIAVDSARLNRWRGAYAAKELVGRVLSLKGGGVKDQTGLSEIDHVDKLWKRMFGEAWTNYYKLNLADGDRFRTATPPFRLDPLSSSKIWLNESIELYIFEQGLEATRTRLGELINLLGSERDKSRGAGLKVRQHLTLLIQRLEQYEQAHDGGYETRGRFYSRSLIQLLEHRITAHFRETFPAGGEWLTGSVGAVRNPSERAAVINVCRRLLDCINQTTSAFDTELRSIQTDGLPRVQSLFEKLGASASTRGSVEAFLQNQQTSGGEARTVFVGSAWMKPDAINCANQLRNPLEPKPGERIGPTPRQVGAELLKVLNPGRNETGPAVWLWEVETATLSADELEKKLLDWSEALAREELPGFLHPPTLADHFLRLEQESPGMGRNALREMLSRCLDMSTPYYRYGKALAAGTMKRKPEAFFWIDVPSGLFNHPQLRAVIDETLKRENESWTVRESSGSDISALHIESGVPLAAADILEPDCREALALVSSNGYRGGVFTRGEEIPEIGLKAATGEDRVEVILGLLTGTIQYSRSSRKYLAELCPRIGNHVDPPIERPLGPEADSIGGVIKWLRSLESRQSYNQPLESIRTANRLALDNVLVLRLLRSLIDYYTKYYMKSEGTADRAAIEKLKERLAATGDRYFEPDDHETRVTLPARVLSAWLHAFCEFVPIGPKTQDKIVVLARDVRLAIMSGNVNPHDVRLDQDRMRRTLEFHNLVFNREGNDRRQTMQAMVSTPDVFKLLSEVPGMDCADPCNIPSEILRLILDKNERVHRTQTQREE